MRSLLRGLALAILFLAPTCASAAPLYGLFVGINDYPKESGIPALSGSHADVAAIKSLLVSHYGLRPQDIVELYDGRATRAGIGAALKSQIERAAATPGATVVFYYSGHGGRVDDERGDQRALTNSTLVSYDARSGGVVRDILDVELKTVIDKANEEGVNVVTIFDSCNSATATRGIRPRHVRSIGPPKPGSALASDALPTPTAPQSATPGSRVHLGAAQDDEAAGESRDRSGGYRGDFTVALEAALLQHPGATYEDLATTVGDKLANQGVSQHPHAEGAITTRFLGSDASDLPLYHASLQDRAYIVEGGALANVTPGSKFDVYASVEGAREAHPVANGTIVEAGATQARLQLDAPAAPAPQRAYLLETTHSYPAEPLGVGLDAPEGQRARLAALVDSRFAKVVTDQPQVVIQATPGGSRLVDIYGMPLTATLGDADIGKALRKFAQARAFLGLAQQGGTAQVSLSILSDCHKAFCPALPLTNGEVALEAKTPFEVVVRNDDPAKTYFVYAFAVEPDFSIHPLNVMRESDQGQTEQLGPQPLVVAAGTADPVTVACGLPKTERDALANNERTWFAVVASDKVLPPEALAQDGVARPRSVQGKPLAELIAGAFSGARSVVTAPPNAWAVRTASLRALPPDLSRACPAP